MRYSTPSLRMLKLMALGATSFWLPDTFWHAIRGSKFNGLDVCVITVLLPITLLAMYLYLKRRPANEAQNNVGPPLMLGVWMLGCFFIAAGSSFTGGGFGGPEGFRGGVIAALIGLMPPFTYVIATYDGSLGALILATIAAILFMVKMHWTHARNPANPR